MSQDCAYAIGTCRHHNILRISSLFGQESVRIKVVALIA